MTEFVVRLYAYDVYQLSVVCGFHLNTGYIMGLFQIMHWFTFLKRLDR